MNKLISVGRIFFAIAFIGLGIEHFVFNEFITGRAPKWPKGLFPGPVPWAYVSGVVIVATGIAILTGKKGRIACISAGIFIFIWAFLRHIPVLAEASLLAPKWTTAGKALTFFGGAFAMASTFPKEENIGNISLRKFMNREREFIVLAQCCLGTFMIITGFQHFIYTKFVASLIPSWFPGDPVFWTYFAGVALITGGIGLLIPQTAGYAALFSGLMLFSWFWIIHIPRAFTSVSDGISIFESLAVSGMAFAIAGSLHKYRAIRLKSVRE